MALDGLALAAITTELSALLVNGRIDKIHQPEPEEVVMQIRSQGQNWKLLLSAHPKNARVHLTQQSKANPLHPPLFCMVLRKHLEGGRIIGLHQPALERILEIQVEAPNELGGTAPKTLICEIMGKHSNIILIDPVGGLILDGIKRYSHAVSRHREVLPGRPYLPPPAQGKRDCREMEEESFRKMLLAAPLEEKVVAILQSNLAGFSPQSAREIMARADLDMGLTLESCGDWELQRLWQALQELTAPLRGKPFEPTLVMEGGHPRAFAPFPLRQFPEEMQVRDNSINWVLERYYSQRTATEQLGQKKLALIRQVKDHLERCQRKIQIQKDILAEGESTNQDKILGELLTANLYQLTPGQSQVEVINFYDPEGATITISLDPRLTPSENAQAYFRRYTKGRTAMAMAQEYLAQGQEEAHYLETVLNGLAQTETEAELAQIREELEEQGYIKAKALGRGKKKTPPPFLPTPMTFRSTQGFTLLVGKNNRQNDYLTMKMAKAQDLWLHVKDMPGAHVVVKNEGQGDIPEQTLLEAAILAAYFSRGRESSKVEVDTTWRKHVRKPPGAKPGMVIYDHQKTIMVTPDEKIVKDLSLQ